MIYNLLENTTMSCDDILADSMREVFYRSGRFFNQLGQYHKCLENDQMKYSQFLFANLTTQKPNRLFLGTCVPKVCSLQQLNETINGIIQPYGVYSYFSLDNPQLYQYPYDWSFYFTTTILSLLFIFLIIATVTKIKQLKSFDIVQSVKIFQYKQNPLNVFNGWKSLAMMWVVIGHQYQVRISNSANLVNIDNQQQTYFFLITQGGFFAVDIFFYIGGFLVAYSFLRSQGKSILKYPMAIVHRLLRFWPSYIMALLIFYSIFLHTGSGPFWWQLESMVIAPCRNMWKPIFFVDNLVDNGASMCMGWGWYLQNDMQIFVYSLIILFLYSVNKIAAFSLCALSIIGSNIYVYYSTYISEYVHVTNVADFAKWGEYFTNIYIKPWARCPPYIYGLVFGCFYVEYLKEQKKLKELSKQSQLEEPTKLENVSTFGKLKAVLIKKRFLRYIMEFSGLFVFLFMIFIPRTTQVGYKWSQSIQSLYLTFSPLFIAVGVSLVTLPSLLNVPSLVFFMMDTKFFNFISKVSFWTYLIHYMLVARTDYNQKVDFFYSTYSIFGQYGYHVVFSIFLGTIGTLLIEVPFSKLEKKLFEILMPPRKNRQQKTDNSSISASKLNQQLIPKQGHLNYSVKQ